MKNKRHSILGVGVYFIHLLLIFILPVSLMATKAPFTAEGSGYNKEQAIHSALRAAVEKSLGVFITSQTKIENYQMISDKILSQTKGYVSDYSIVPGSERSEFGLTFIKVNAKVKTTALRDDLEAMKLIYSLKNLPRIMVIVKEHSPGMTLTQRTTATVLENALIKKGFRLVDKAQTDKIQERDRARFSDNSFAAKMGFRLGADLIITGEAEAGIPVAEDVYGIKQWRAPCQMNLRLIRTDNAQLISSVPLSNDWASQSRMQAMNSSLKRTAVKAGEQIINDLLSFWKDEIYNTAIIEVCVLGMGNRELSSFTERVLKVNTTRNASLRYLEGTNAVLDVEITGTVQNLREAFTRMRDISVEAMTYNRIDIKKIARATEPSPEIRFEVTEPDISIVKAQIDPIFPCIYSLYAKKSIGTVIIRNNTAHAISDATLAVTVPHYTTLPTYTNVSAIPPGRQTPLDFKLTMDTKAIHNLSEPVQAQAGITLQYSFQGSVKKRELTVPVTIEKSNAIKWSTPEMAATFITPNNAAVKTVSRAALAIVPVDDDEQIISELMQAAAIYHTLKELGVSYVKDPHAAPGHDVTDIINYPVQTLELKSGDCDDISVLLASLLESIGIETSLIVYPDHVLVMFNTCIYEKNHMRVSYDKKQYIIHHNQIWIPVETTQLQKFSFIEAWHSASECFNTAVNDGMNISFVDIHKAWEMYPPVDPIQKKTVSLKPDAVRVKAAFTNDIALLKQKLDNGFKKVETAYKNEVKKKATAPALNRLGILYARKGVLAEAKKMFEKACAKDRSFAAAHNNLANIYCLNGIDAQSTPTYDKAISLNSQQGQYYINKGLCLLTQNKTDASIETIRTGIAKLDRPEAAEKILGIDLFKTMTTLKGAKKKEPTKKQEVSKARIKNLMKKVLDKVPDEEIKGYSKNILPVGGLRGADPEQIEKIADLLWWDE